ncbi:hypothetical protein K493DRAFT_348349 [Basidiobolus meristosporus CBS 931.73]|uniref:GPI anchored serine-threonine rich protein n=1 Tax=Basidiobolus meristosporus CBS 931.73 TaxID=1314790 RepID=A0A1Y1YNW8_9FUNG|nr:hypothetical protein K493DRAFT_348349 [Basidiobolus meristosporus CBS 931.73]|eukprot:ORX99709.1 hypothetical protein K493DRAFT_348349 [Basidiobolus meristosporus CBS 931.73]
MKFTSFALVLASIASLAVAQTNDTCAAAANMNSCIEINTNKQTGCGTDPAQPNPALCKCQYQHAIVTCYSNCPDSAKAQGDKKLAEAQVQILCASFPNSVVFATATGSTPSIATPSSSPSVGTNPSGTTGAVAPVKTNSAARNLAGGSLAIAGLFAVLAL